MNTEKIDQETLEILINDMKNGTPGVIKCP